MKSFDDKEIIYGRRPVMETVRGFRKIFKIYGTAPGIKWLKNELRTHGIDLKILMYEVDKQKLQNICGHSDHQGIVAEVEPFEYTSFRSILSRKPKLLLIADRITDVHNLGAMIRTAHLCGVGAVIIPDKSSASITPPVVHSSAGATEHTPIVCENSIAHTIQVLKEHNYFVIAAQIPHANTIPLNELEIHDNIAVVMGSEGEGISSKIIERCDVSVSISQSGIIDSFNVSVATGIILHYIAVALEILK